ncbi:hypothetical protein BDZ90DRAFT_231049 [Jaminaea rosea]|uniref:F-box protein Hrt3/FBXO9 C-terminal domain-containing protein n=1 Tax=Jaminaea rosea TaxID=1569628 RepID=A0A316UW71_9BASI|nr:hypothetical protein BDZ90DRAFT_231049 [Jaminaea rosea]PWN29048.1 hypothetical protein BDZ90DRAFT_231049 [Jaminaea rosea]
MSSPGGSTPSLTPSRAATPAVDSPSFASTPNRTATPATADDNDQLAQFRRQWREEVRNRTGVEPSTQAPSSSAQAGPSIPRRDVAEHDAGDEDDARPHSPSRTRHLLALAEEQERAERAEAANNESEGQRAKRRLPPRQMVGENAPAQGSAGTVSKMKAAVKAYATAVENERKGDLDEALFHYRKAFRLDTAADRLYERAYALLRHTDSDDNASVSTERQRDALLASPEVADMVRRATDFDDVRVAAIEKMQAKVKEAKEAKQQDARPGKDKEQKGMPKQPPTSPRRQTKEQQVEGVAALGQRDELAEIISKAATNEEVEGRDLSTISFTSPPPSISKGGGGQTGQDDLADKMQGASLEKDQEAVQEQETQPPPPIAKLPDEILAHICRCVVEPRGKRGARIRPPKVEVGDAAAARSASAAVKVPGAKPAPTPQAEPSSNIGINKPSQPIGVGIVLAGPDWQSLEMLARTCWKWRLTSRSRHLWAYIVAETYQEPQLPLPSHLSTPSAGVNPRLTFIHHPRLRLTGCYIAACHYSRQGLSVDNVWVRVVHLVEFYRSIRFLPDGRALTLLTTDQPRDTVGKMHAGNSDQGFAVGRWRVELPSRDTDDDDDQYGAADDEDILASLKSSRHRGDARVIIEDLRDRTRPKYSFQMILSLRSTSRGKWNKMEMLDYRSVNLETGEVVSIPNKHSRPFHFSAVRSFGV